MKLTKYYVLFGAAWVTYLVSSVDAKEARILRLSDRSVGKVVVTPGRTTILSFPTKPTKVILGNRDSFAIEYVENDLAVSATRPNSHSNLFVYLEGRRFAFDLLASSQNGDEIVVVHDVIEKRVEVKVK